MASTAAASTYASNNAQADFEDFGHEHDTFDPLLGRDLSTLHQEPVFPLIQRVRSEVVEVIDTTLSYDQLRQNPTLNFSIVRPLSLKLSRGERPPSGLIYALLVCRVHFLDVASDDLAFAGVNTSRADLCELLAIKLLSAYGSAPQSLELLHVLTLCLNPFAGATTDSFTEDESVDEAELARLLDWGQQESSNALELGVFSKAKRFVRSPLVQQVIKAIYTGEVMYSPHSTHSFIKDDYKQKPTVEVYDWKRQPFLDHNRLRVPRIRNRLEFFTFSSILVLFLATELTHDPAHVSIVEVLFVLFSIGFSLDEFASIQENGLSTYAQGAYNVLDCLFCINFFAYLGIRIAGLVSGDLAQSELAFDALALAGCILFPRLTISLIRGNVILLALSAMIKEFVLFMGLACLVGAGFLCTLFILGRGSWDLGRISWLMLKIWLGNSFLGFEAAQQFHPFFGPALIVAFAILTQTLLLTILISLLSNTFAAIQGQAETEILHQNALRTIERVKSDALTSYMPPLNLIALAILLPLRWLATPRWVHKVHVALTKILNFPVLLFLAVETRVRHKRGYLFNAAIKTQRALSSLPRGIPFEGTVDSISEVFERQVTSRALAVASIDNPTPEETEAEQATAVQAVTSSKSPVTRVRGLGLVRSASYGPGRSVGQHSRMGSLASPLAKMFNVDGGAPSTKGGKGKDVKEKEKDGGESAAKGVEARLEAIEAALAILVGEVVKTNEGAAEEKRPPLTSLTGEQSYIGDEQQ
ncbi:hypothetical protein BCR35DRAFT_321483 [Leucosporidium creatinivorum]|uniref:Uncharacterized protein n=1 Tax=Leucosporidium creatinivorum TaxID=106004 RepID=A0A1Y2F6P0_9BASI|nr:hypothetical protein BCR35DRAFT_321483 [Leucosporidium creatinivorum]